MAMQLHRRPAVTNSSKIWTPSSTWNTTELTGCSSAFKTDHLPNQRPVRMCKVVQTSFNNSVHTLLWMAIWAHNRVKVNRHFPDRCSTRFSHWVPISIHWTPRSSMSVKEVMKVNAEARSLVAKDFSLKRWRRRITRLRSPDHFTLYRIRQCHSCPSQEIPIYQILLWGSSTSMISVSLSLDGATVSLKPTDDGADQGLADKTTGSGLDSEYFEVGRKGSLLGTKSTSASLSLYKDSAKPESRSDSSQPSRIGSCFFGNHWFDRMDLQTLCT